MELNKQFEMTKAAGTAVENAFASYNDPPKNKLNKSNNAIVNKQDDNSYEEPVTDNTSPKENNEPRTNAKKSFEYSDSGEFENDTHILDTNPNDEYL